MEPRSFENKLGRVGTQLKKIIGLGYDKSFNKAWLLSKSRLLLEHELTSYVESQKEHLILSLLANKIWHKTWKLNLTLLETGQDENTKEYIEKRGN